MKIVTNTNYQSPVFHEWNYIFDTVTHVQST
jgi:hypothetical protein